ncbi:MAG: hypothetical protein UY71_C0002G0006 [Parcubacteria group bacterium GW2011_GWB1_52_7]|nr:MAG: hypothetical protein UY64_C0003G0008 [Parcubacteria group bacterium GW2011_GWA1_51_12]KKW29161.1 MAG: hypothetical protein UY71_C0002G0006 [Parcubacteria group bacterium GW2011_GWB1_52_7]
MTRKEFYAVVLIFLVAAFLRFHNLRQFPPGLYPDEAMNGNNVIEAQKTGGWKVFYPENNGREGLFLNLQGLLLQYAGQNEPWVLRFPSAVFGTLSVIGLFFLLYELALLARLRDPFAIAFAGAFMMAASLWHVIFSRIGFRAIMAPFFLTWGVYFAILAFRKMWFRAAVFSGIAFGLGMYSYIAYRLMPALVLVLLPSFWKRRGFWHIAVAVPVTAVIVVLPLGFYFFQHPADFLGRTSPVSVFSSERPLYDLGKNILLTLGMFNVRGDSNWRHNIAGAPQLFFPVGILFLAGFFLALRRRSVFDWLFVSWLLLAFLPVVISNEGIPHALRSILMIPAVFGLAGAGACLVYEWLEKHFEAGQLRILVAVFLILVFVNGYYSYFYAWGRNQNVPGAFAADYVAIGRKINALPRSEPKYIAVLAGGADVRGVPMPAQTVMFITDSFLPSDQRLKNIHYLTRDQYESRKAELSGENLFFIK